MEAQQVQAVQSTLAPPVGLQPAGTNFTAGSAACAPGIDQAKASSIANNDVVKA